METEKNTITFNLSEQKEVIKISPEGFFYKEKKLMTYTMYTKDLMTGLKKQK